MAEDIISFLNGILDAVDTFGMKWSYARYLKDARISADSDAILCVSNPKPIADIVDIFSEFYICRLDANGRPLLGTGRYRVSDYEPQKNVLLEKTNGASGPDRILALAEKHADMRYEQLR